MTDFSYLVETFNLEIRNRSLFNGGYILRTRDMKGIRDDIQQSISENNVSALHHVLCM
jgi:hypothetical protein